MKRNLLAFIIIVLTLPITAYAVENESTTYNDEPIHPALNQYNGIDIYRRTDIIYFYDQLKEELKFNWGAEGVEERFPSIAVTAGGKPCHSLSQKKCRKLMVPQGSTITETFRYIGSDISGIHHYEGFLKLVSPQGRVIRSRKTHCNTLPSSTANVGCPFDRGIDI